MKTRPHHPRSRRRRGRRRGGRRRVVGAVARPGRRARRDVELSTQVLDRNGRLLRPYATPEGRWRLPATVDDVDPRFSTCCIAYEDRRFREHRGVDPLAMVRAAVQFVGNGRIISGGSTLTMQVARLLEPRDRTHARRQAAADGARDRARARAEQGRDARALSRRLRPMAAISKACARRRSPISARSRSGSRSAKRRCWSRCRNRRKLRRPDRSAHAARARARPRARPHRQGRNDSRRRSRARQARSRCRPARRPMPTLAPHAADQAVAAAPKQQGASADHRRELAEESRGPGARAGAARSAPTSRSRSSRSTTRPAKCWRASPRPIISTSAAPVRST